MAKKLLAALIGTLLLFGTYFIAWGSELPWPPGWKGFEHEQLGCQVGQFQAHSTSEVYMYEVCDYDDETIVMFLDGRPVVVDRRVERCDTFLRDRSLYKKDENEKPMYGIMKPKAEWPKEADWVEGRLSDCE